MIRIILLVIIMFSTLACAEESLDCKSPQTMMEIDTCKAKEATLIERVMSVYYEKSKKQYQHSPSVVAAIIESQVNWKKYHDEHCGGVWEASSSGSVRNLMYLECSIRLTKQRTYDLWQAYLSNMGSGTPLAPKPERC